MGSTVLLKLIAGVILAGVITGGLYSGWKHIENIGYKKAEVVYEQKIKEYENTILKKIDKVETNSKLLLTKSEESNKKLSKDIATILSGVKGETLTIIKNGECVPSKVFSDSFGNINKRVNENIKDKE